MEERAIEVYKWILYNINGYSKEELDSMCFSDDDYEICQLLDIIELGKKYDEV